MIGAPEVREATVDDLPEETTHGFKIVVDGETLLFFHWHSVPKETMKIPSAIPGEPERETLVRRTSYGQVVNILPLRLKQVGLEAMTDSIMDQVRAMFGPAPKKEET